MTSNTDRPDDSLEPNIERERKFIVRDISILKHAQWSLVQQSYIFNHEGYTIRVRRQQDPTSQGVADGRATIDIKGPRRGDEREEHEFEIPSELAASIIAMGVNVIRKKRHSVVSEGEIWEVDEFMDDNRGLVVAELEGRNIRMVRSPWWAPVEVTGDSRYDNENLASSPWSTWA